MLRTQLWDPDGELKEARGEGSTPAKDRECPAVRHDQELKSCVEAKNNEA